MTQLKPGLHSMSAGAVIISNLVFSSPYTSNHPPFPPCMLRSSDELYWFSIPAPPPWPDNKQHWHVIRSPGPYTTPSHQQICFHHRNMNTEHATAGSQLRSGGDANKTHAIYRYVQRSKQYEYDLKVDAFLWDRETVTISSMHVQLYTTHMDR